MWRNDVQVWCELNVPNVTNFILESRVFISRRIASDQSYTAPIGSDTTDAGTAASPGLGYDEHFHEDPQSRPQVNDFESEITLQSLRQQRPVTRGGFPFDAEQHDYPHVSPELRDELS